MFERRDDMVQYYARRATEFERIYSKPERQDDLRRLESMLSECFTDLDVLEIACGTGYWTQIAALSARSIVAVDCNDEVLDIARRRDFGRCPTDFIKSDAYTLEGVSGEFSAGLMAFWWSHVAQIDLPRFLRVLHGKLAVGATVFVLDNRYVKGSNTRVSRTDGDGNTYQVRRLSDGSEHEVLKNFPNAATFAKTIDGYGSNLEFTELPYYWVARYQLTGMPDQQSTD